jgi:hypothetical protein
MEMNVWLSRAGGIVTLSHLLVGRPQGLAGKGYRQTSHNLMQRYLKERGASTFGACTIVPEFFRVSRISHRRMGWSAPPPTAFLFGWARKATLQERQLQLMHDLLKLDKSALFLNYHSKRGYGNHRRIDVWWRGRDRNAQLMLTHIIRSNEAWENAEIRLLRLLEN